MKKTRRANEQTIRILRRPTRAFGWRASGGNTSSQGSCRSRRVRRHGHQGRTEATRACGENTELKKLRRDSPKALGTALEENLSAIRSR